MPYESVDALQKVLAEEVFHHTADRKKAAGRALGTIVELITYYVLRQWNLTSYLTIELRLPEFGNREITHNVEFGIHPQFVRKTFKGIQIDKTPISRASL